MEMTGLDPDPLEQPSGPAQSMATPDAKQLLRTVTDEQQPDDNSQDQ